MPDLVITHIWSTSAIIYYKARNQGAGDSKLCQTYLYIDNVHLATDYTEPLAPGEERIKSFPNYSLPNGSKSEDEIKMDVGACVDEDRAVAESHEGNNCIHQIWGPTWGKPRGR